MTLLELTGMARTIIARTYLPVEIFFAAGMFYLLMAYVLVRGFKLLESGFYASAPWISGAIGALIGGLVCDRLSKRRGIGFGCRVPIVIGLVAAGALMLAGATAHDPILAVVFLSLCLAFQQSTEGAFWAATISVSGKHSSSACGVLNTGGNVVGGVGALMVPVTVKLFGWTAALATGAGFALLGALLWLWIRADRPFPEPA